MEFDNNLSENLVTKSQNSSQIISSLNILASKINTHFVILSRDFSLSLTPENDQLLLKEYGSIKSILVDIESEVIDIIELSKLSVLKENYENFYQRNKVLLSVQNEINTNLPLVSKLIAIKSSKDNSVAILVRKLNNLANQELDIEIHEQNRQPLLSDPKISAGSEKSHKSYLFATLSMSFLILGYIVMAYIYYLSFLKDLIYFSSNSEENQL